MTLLEPLLRLTALDALPRTGWILAGVPNPESIAGHVLGTAHLALALAPRVEPPLDLGRVLSMVLVHDSAEALSGDLPRAAGEALPEGAKSSMEEALARRVALPPDATDAWAEYRARETREARFAHLCDKLQLGVRLVGYLRAGQGGLEEFGRGVEALDTSEFSPLVRMQAEILAAIAP